MGMEDILLMKLKPKKAEMEDLMKIILWIVFFGIALLLFNYSNIAFILLTPEEELSSFCILK